MPVYVMKRRRRNVLNQSTNLAEIGEQWWKPSQSTAERSELFGFKKLMNFGAPNASAELCKESECMVVRVIIHAKSV